MAAVFLALLYNSPAGLVLYWTCNNIFSLGKNIVLKLKHPGRFSVTAGALACAAIIVYVLFVHPGAFNKRLLTAAAFALLLAVPALCYALRRPIAALFAPLASNQVLTRRLFFTSAAALTLLCGLAIPALVIASSPQEFSFIDGHASPFYFLGNSLLASSGLLLLWPSVVFFLFRQNVKTALAALFFLLLVFGLVDVFAFPGNYGTISNTFRFDSPGSLKTPL